MDLNIKQINKSNINATERVLNVMREVNDEMNKLVGAYVLLTPHKEAPDRMLIESNGIMTYRKHISTTWCETKQEYVSKYEDEAEVYQIVEVRFGSNSVPFFECKPVHRSNSSSTHNRNAKAEEVYFLEVE